MSVRRTSAVINQQLDLRMNWLYDDSGNLFDPSTVDQVEIIDANTGTVLQTITTIVNLSVGKYQVITTNTWNTTARTIRDRWRFKKVATSTYEYLEGSTVISDTTSLTDGMSSFITLVKRKVQDGKPVLADPADYEALIQEALKHYSRFRPVVKVDRLTGSANAYFTVPSSWENGFSWIKNIEYPLDGLPPYYIDQNGYEVAETDTEVLVRFLGYDYPADGDDFFFRYAIRHTITDTANSIIAADKDAFCNLAAYYCCLAIANYYSQTSDSTLDADVISYRTKGDEFKSRADGYLKAFQEKVKPDLSGITGEWDMEAYWGKTEFIFRDRLIN